MSEESFWTLLQLISVEVENAFIAFHSFEELNRLAINDPAILEVLQADALFWNVHRSALQTMMLMTLSRLFDPAKDAKTFQTLLTATIGNPQLFNRESLRARKLKSGVDPACADEYLAQSWFPANSGDLKFLQKEFEPLSKYFGEVYLPIRNHVYAHRLTSDEEASRDLFPKTNRSILRETVNALYDFTRIIENLYVNGAKPIIGKYDVPQEASRIRSIVESPLRKLVK